MTVSNVAQTILAQLGGRKFIAMTGAKNLMAGDNSLQFAIPTSNKINRVRITLTPADTYTVEFFNVRGYEFKLLSTHDDVYCDQLADVFESSTGLVTTL
jgi:hypothetical protein